ncbi:MAG: peptidase S8 [Bacteroidetes bacterium QS_9_68_14]|nr:MAG: peptidase S8 [Bacteroidetes bacterium QS_9_68_14]
MTPRRFLPLFVALLLVAAAGCSTSREATQPNPAPPPSDTEASETGAPETEEAPPADTEAPAPREEPGGPPAEPAAPNEREDAERENGTAAGPVPTDWQHLSAGAGGYPGIATERAYDWLGDRAPQDTVVVAVLDGGVDPDHEDLDGVLWTNAGEVPGNGEDDNGNGYVDDTHGWNFLGNASGENVEHDTFEVTRLYVELRDPYEGANPDTLTAAERETYRRYQRIKADFQKQKQQYEQRYDQVQQIARFVEQARPLLVQQAARLVSGLLERTDTADLATLAEDLQKAEEQLRTRAEYNFNPDYNPRPIVGDDYSDATERIYGNADVQGPDAGHGTGVASLIAAERDNDLGIRGVAGAVRIMPVRAVPGGDERDKDVANAIRYATNNGADIINMSFGKAYSPRKEVVDAAVRHAEDEGVLMVHAAGNDGADVDTTDSYPSAHYADGSGAADNWIEVGASTAEGDSLLAAPFSNYGGERVDLFAPGASMQVARPGDAYGRAQGTSFAAPVVSGVAALVMAYYPSLSAEQVKEAILSSATSRAGQMVKRPGRPSGGSGGGERVRFGTLSRTGGVANAYAALRAAERMAE